MADCKKNCPPPIQRLRGAELECFYTLSASLKELDHVKNEMEPRLRSIPGAWRDISMIHTVLAKLVEKLLNTVPQDKLLSMKRNMRSMMCRLYLVKPVSMPADETVLATRDLTALVQAAHAYACTACDNDCNKCEIGKALDHIMIQCRARNESWSYIDGVGDYKGGQEIP